MTLHNRDLDQDASIQEHLKFQMFCNRMFSPTMGVKSVGTFTVILLNLETPPLPPQRKLNFEQNG